MGDYVFFFGGGEGVEVGEGDVIVFGVLVGSVFFLVLFRCSIGVSDGGGDYGRFIEVVAQFRLIVRLIVRRLCSRYLDLCNADFV